jgi:ribose 5-phosphate isomerase A
MFDVAKKAAGVYAADFVKQGMTIGIGSGSTVQWFIEELGKRVRQGLMLTAVPTSRTTAQLASQVGIPLIDLSNIDRLSVTVDGADEIDPQGQLIKGGGGALLQEKIVAAASEKLLIIADGSKLVESLGKFPLPVEVIPFAHRQVQRAIFHSNICKKITLRQAAGKVFVTDHHNYILDCECEEISNASALNISLHLIPGVVETGLFPGMADQSIIGYDDGRVEIIKYR